MGLQGQLSDVSSDSIPLMLVALLATLFKHVRSFFLRLCSSGPHLSVDDASASVSSGLANLVVLADQLNLNRLFSYRYADNAVSECIVCLSTLKVGEEVRKLECRHVFHKKCLEGWIQHLNFNCPLCRSPLLVHSISSSFPLHSTTSTTTTASH